MVSKKNSNIMGLLDSSPEEQDASKDQPSQEGSKAIANPAIALGAGKQVKRADAERVPILKLDHDQVRFYKYHDRLLSSTDNEKVRSLKKSIEREGQLFPGVVRKTQDTTEDGHVIYELVVGRLRYEATRGIQKFSAFLKELDDSQAARLMIAENEERADITPFERWLSVIPLVEDNVLQLSEISKLIKWDKGNLSRSMVAKNVYTECQLDKYLVDVDKVKLNTLLEVGKLYEESPKLVKDAIQYIEDNHSTLRDNIFLKGIINRIVETRKRAKETLFLSGSKVKIKVEGQKVTLEFDGLPSEDEFPSVIEKLSEMKAIK